MKLSHTVRTLVILLVLPRLATGQARLVATVERVTGRANLEVPYPTDLSRRIAASNRAAENVIKSMLVRSGDASRDGDVGRVAPNQAPVRSTLDVRERAEVQKEVDLAREWIPEAPAPAPPPSPRPAPTPAPTPPASRGGGGGA